MKPLTRRDLETKAALDEFYQKVAELIKNALRCMGVGCDPTEPTEICVLLCSRHVDELLKRRLLPPSIQLHQSTFTWDDGLLWVYFLTLKIAKVSRLDLRPLAASIAPDLVSIFNENRP